MLNNPHKRQAPPKAHSALPAVLPADLPRVRRKDFDSYLRAISPEWDRYEKNGELAKDDQPSQLDGPSTPRASLSSQSAMTPRTLRHVQGKSMPPLNSVPSIFFEPVFNLGDPRTFNTVTETGDGYDDNSDPSSLSHSLPLLEKFSHYADTVEQHLVREISLRSTSFFAALTNLHELQSESEQCLDRISKLRGLLKDVDENAAKRGLQMVRKESRMRNLHGLREGIKMVSSVVEITSVARGLVAAGQWGEALGVIEEIENLWKAEPISVSTPTPTTTRSFLSSPSRNSVRSSLLPPMPETSVLETKSTRPPPVSLSSLHAFASLPSSLQAMTMEITSALSSELVNVLRVDLVDRMASESVPPTLAQMDADLALKDRLRPLLQGLSRTKGVRNATLTWREVVIGEVRAVTKRVRFFRHSDSLMSMNAWIQILASTAFSKRGRCRYPEF
jgi:vacuolar protein sorting-associated protein 54